MSRAACKAIESKFTYKSKKGHSKQSANDPTKEFKGLKWRIRSDKT